MKSVTSNPLLDFIYGKTTTISYLSIFGKKKHFGLMDILFVILAKLVQKQYNNTYKIKDNYFVFISIMAKDNLDFYLKVIKKSD